MRVTSLLNSGADVETTDDDDDEVCYIPSMVVCSIKVLCIEFNI